MFLLGSLGKYSVQRSESVSSPCLNHLPHSQESGLLCVHPSFWKNPARFCQLWAHRRFLREPAGVSWNAGCPATSLARTRTARGAICWLLELRQSLRRHLTCLPYDYVPAPASHQVPVSICSFLGSVPFLPSHQPLSWHHKQSPFPPGVELFCLF